jgi:hypothetical protein
VIACSDTAVLCFRCVEIQFTTSIFKEGRTFAAEALELDVSSCGGTKEKALRNLKGAVRLFLEEAEKMGPWNRSSKKPVTARPSKALAAQLVGHIHRVPRSPFLQALLPVTRDPEVERTQARLN